MAPSILRALLALAAAGALLTTSSAGYAAWYDAHGAAPSGPGLEAGPISVSVTTPDGASREIDPKASLRVVVGDTVSVRMPLTLRTGGAPTSILRAEIPAPDGDAALARELAANPTPFRVTSTSGGPGLRAVAGRAGSFEVPANADGHAYVLEWRTSTRPTRDGGAATAKNAWGSGPASLQGLSVGARPLTVTLEAATAAPAPAPSPTGSSTP